MTQKNIKITEINLKKIPKNSGVYLFLDSAGKAIYIGKAVNLRHRLASYFRGKVASKTAQIIKNASKIKIIATASDFEALLLEAKLIKKHQPKYNVCLKDDKRYLYLKITHEDWPQVGTARKATPQATLFGPFPSAKTVRLILKQIRQIFPYRSCQKMPKNPRLLGGQVCLYYHLGLCPGPCLNNSPEDKKKYHQQIEKIKKVLSGQSQSLIKQYEREMKRAAKKENYEASLEAKKIHDSLIFLTQQKVDPNFLLADLDLKENNQDRLKDLKDLLNQHFESLTSLKRIETYDIANISGQEATGSMAVFTSGQPDTGQYRQFKIKQEAKPNDPKMMAEVLQRRLKHPEWPMPNLIVVDGGKPQLSAALSALAKNNLNIPVLGLAKREETIIIKEKANFISINLNQQSPAMLILRAGRDEAHRFAQKYHHYLRKKQFETR